MLIDHVPQHPARLSCIGRPSRLEPGDLLPDKQPNSSPNPDDARLLMMPQAYEVAPISLMRLHSRRIKSSVIAAPRPA